MTAMVPRLIKLPDVIRLSGLQMTSVYGQVKAGLFPPHIKLTERSTAWVEHEVAAVNAARIAGQSDNEIRALVVEIVAGRAELARELIAAGRGAGFLKRAVKASSALAA